MSARYLSMAVVVALAAVSPAKADSAKAAEGSDRARTIGARHHSPSGSRPGPTAVRSGGRSAPSSLTGAQSRHPRAGTGSGPRHYSYGRSRGYYPYYPYSTYYGYGAFPYFDFYYGHGYYGAPYYHAGYYGGRYYGRDVGSVRVLVDPSETRVYVDGYYAGTADDFDGLFQRLHVAPGRHELALKLEGYRTHRMSVYVPYDGTLKLHYDMVRGGGEETFEDMVGDRDARRDEASWRREPREGRSRDEGREQPDPRRREGSFERQATGEERNGTLRLDVRPEGASIYVDGEFRGTGRTLQRLELPAGPHRVEILHPGLRTFERDVTLQEGEGTDLEVELTK